MAGCEPLKALEEHKHIPVLLTEVIEGLAVHPGGHYLDATIGGGGHTQAILNSCEPDGCVLGLDRDPEAVARVRRRFEHYGQRVNFVHASFDHLTEIAEDEKFLPLDGVLFDLGFSSWQIENPNRGFSHRLDGPLDMRYDPGSLIPTAEMLVNTYTGNRIGECDLALR